MTTNRAILTTMSATLTLLSLWAGTQVPPELTPITLVVASVSVIITPLAMFFI